MGAWYWGLVKDQFTADDEVRKRVAEITKGKTTDRDKVTAVYDYVVAEDALRRARVRHPRLQAVPLHADLRARVRRLQRQGDAHRHDAQGARHPRDDRHRPHGAARRLRRLRRRASRPSITPSPTCRRSTCTSTAPPNTRARPSSRPWTAARSRSRSTRASRSSSTCPIRRATASVTSRSVDGDARGRRLGADRLARHGERRVRLVAGACATTPSRSASSASRKTSATDLPGIEVTSVDANDLENVEVAPDLKVRARVPQFARRDQNMLSVPVGPAITW